MKDFVSLHLSLVSNHILSNFSLKEKEVSELKNELRKNKYAFDNLKKLLKTQRKFVKSIVIASILFAILLVFPNMWQIDSTMLKMKEDVSIQLRASKLEVMNLTKQRLEVLQEELKESLSTTYKFEIDRLLKQTYENTISSQFSDTSCEYSCLSLPEAKLNMIETEVEYLRQRLDYPSLPVLIRYAELNQSGDRLLSIPFYACASESCTSGYLMRLAVYPNETGSGANTHMSVYIHLMKGKYDNILSWPFGGIIKVILQYAGDQEILCAINFSNLNDSGSRVLNGTMSAHGLWYRRSTIP